jgi:hypothetical protein
MPLRRLVKQACACGDSRVDASTATGHFVVECDRYGDGDG